MKKLILILLIVLFTAGITYAYRMPKPTKITQIDQGTLTELNEILEQLWNITNGRISLDSGSLISTGIGTVKMGSTNNANNTGWLKIERTDGVMVYIPYWIDDTP